MLSGVFGFDVGSGEQAGLQSSTLAQLCAALTRSPPLETPPPPHRMAVPLCPQVDNVAAATWLNGQVFKAQPPPGAVQPGVLKSPIDNFFMTDAISRASPVMARCVQARQSMLYGR